MPNPAEVPLYFLCKAARQRVKVVLSGEGADELFGGYNIYREPHDLLPLTRLPRPIRKGLGAMAQKLPKMKGKNYLIRGSKDLQERFIGNAYMFTPEERKALLKIRTNAPDPMAITKPFYDKVQDQDDVTKMQYLDLHMWMAGDILLKADKMSMAHSLERAGPVSGPEAGRWPPRCPLPPRPTRARRKLPCAGPRHARCPPPAPRAKSSAFLCRCGTGFGRSPTPAGCGPCSAARQRRSSLTRARCIVC